MLRDAINHERLMTASTDRVHLALQSGDPQEQLIAARLLESPRSFLAWESEHAGLMRVVAKQGFRRTQAAILKKATFALIHRKALFEFVRDARIRGDARRRIFDAFRPTQDYTRAVIAEHGLYLRKACSFLCTSHVGVSLVHDPGFFDPLQRYQELYSEYFGAFCHAHFAPRDPADGDAGAPDSQAALLPLLKAQLDECRRAIMNPGPLLERQYRDAMMRQATGDTVRLPVPAPKAARR